LHLCDTIINNTKNCRYHQTCLLRSYAYTDFVILNRFCAKLLLMFRVSDRHQIIGYFNHNRGSQEVVSLNVSNTILTEKKKDFLSKSFFYRLPHFSHPFFRYREKSEKSFSCPEVIIKNLRELKWILCGLFDWKNEIANLLCLSFSLTYSMMIFSLKELT